MGIFQVFGTFHGSNNYFIETQTQSERNGKQLSESTGQLPFYSAVFPLISSVCLIISADRSRVTGHWGKGDGTQQVLETVGNGKALS